MWRWAPPQTHRGGRAGASGVDAEILAGSPLGDQLLVAHELVTALFVGLLTVLAPQGVELLAQGIEDRVVLVHGTVADEVTPNLNRNRRSVVVLLWFPRPLRSLRQIFSGRARQGRRGSTPGLISSGWNGWAASSRVGCSP